MDPNFSDSSLQKTSPSSDPAALMQLFNRAICTSFTAHLAPTPVKSTHHPDRGAGQSTARTKCITAETASHPPPARSSSPPAQVPSINPRLAFPEKFDGESAKCKGFLLQCSLFVNQQPSLYPTDSSRIAFVCSLLTGKALEWATAVWRMDGSAFLTFDSFLQQFREVFEHSADGRNAGDQLLTLSQGRKARCRVCSIFPNSRGSN